MELKTELKDFQKDTVEWMKEHERKYDGGMLCLEPGLGKCHKMDTPILMFDGKIKMVQDIKVGELLMGDDSTSREVLSLAKGQDEMYKISPVKGESYVVNQEHILCLKVSGKPIINNWKNKRGEVTELSVKWFENVKWNTKNFKLNEREKAEEFLKNVNHQEITEIPVKEYIKLNKSIKEKLKGYKVSVDFLEKQLNFDPYIMGLWLGDGSSNGSGITNQDSTILHYLANTLPKYKCYLQYQVRQEENTYGYRINGTGTELPNTNNFMKELRNENLINNKHIPMIYKCNSRENRLKLLAGLLDSDGSLVDDGCTFDITQKSEKLIDDIIYLCRSLGFACYKSDSIKGCWYKGVYREGNYFRISGEGTNEISTLCPRKKANKRKQIKNVLVTGIKVKHVGKDNYYGFTLDGNRRYVMGDFTVTHNTFCSLALIIEKPKKTLIICPASLIDNWVNEIEKHTTLQRLKYTKYYGPDRQTKYIRDDTLIYITSYSIVSREYLDKNSLFAKTKFKRIILDEAHYIRNANSNVSKAVLYLGESYTNSIKKWVVTATPVYNHVNDTFNYFKFLQLEGIDDRKDWTNTITKKIDGLYKLNGWMEKYSISLKKSDVLKELKSKIEKKITLQFNKLEKDFYETLQSYSHSRMKALMGRIKTLKGFQDADMKRILRGNVLTYILRLRQACNSPWLILKNMERLKGASNLEEAIECLKNTNSFFEKNKETPNEDCPICLDRVGDYITGCGHKFCNLCITKVLEHNLNCPVCRAYINEDEIQNTKEKIKKVIQEVDIDDLKNTIKVQKVIKLTKKAIKNKEKIVIVSQWIGFLDIIRHVFKQELPDVKYINLQGNVNMKQRTENIKQFENDKNIKVCFLSLNSSSEGINLVSANHVIFCDLWYNQSKMIQCQDRVHRILQTKQVYIYNLQIENTIEEKIEMLVEKKTKMGNLITNKWGIKDISKYDDQWIRNVIKLLEPAQENAE